MVNVRQPRDVAQILLSVLFLAIMIIACLWIVRPFVLGFAWAATVVVATWPLLLRLQKLLFGRRGLAVLVIPIVELVKACQRAADRKRYCKVK